MIIDELFEGPQLCPECGGISFSDLILAEKKDACYYKVKASAKVWPSAYASGRLVQCRKKGAANYGKSKTEGVAEQQELDEKWSQKYKKSINCANPRGFSQRAHCAGREKNEDVAEAESEAAAQRKQYPSYYQHKDAGTVFRTQNDAGQVMNITPDDEEWDDYYKREFPDMPTPKDGGFWNDDNTAAMVEDTNTVNVPKGQEAKTQPDGSTRISKLGSMSRADYAKNMAAYKAQTQTPEKIADFKQRMASGQGYSNAERQANLQQQQQYLGKDANTGDLDEQGMAEDDDPYTVVSTKSDMSTKDVNGKTAQVYTNTTTATDPKSGKFKKMVSTDVDGKTSSVFTDPEGNEHLDEISLGNYRKKAMMSKAMAQTDRFFGRDNPAKVAAADRTIANRERGLAGADARRRPLTPPPVNQDKQRRDLADKYPNIDELVRQAELNRDPYYDRAEGEAYYRGRDAEHNYHRLKQLQRMIRGAELDEMNFGGVSQTTDSDTGDVTTSFNQGPVSVSQTKTPGGYTKQTDQRFDLGTATLGTQTVGPNIGAGQLAGTTTKTATNNMTGQAKQQVKGVGFGGATGATVGKNYVGATDDELARLAADSVTGINEEPNQATVNVPGASLTANKNTNTVSGQTNVGGAALSATKNITPGAGGSVSASMPVAPNLNLTAKQTSPDYTKGQLAGTKSLAATYTDTAGAAGKPGQQHTVTRTAGVGFGGATGANVGKNYVDQYSVNESIDRLRHLAGIKQSRV